MKSLLKVAFSVFLAISLVLLFVLQIMQGGQLNQLKEEVADLSDIVTQLNGGNPTGTVTPKPTDDPVDPTTLPDGSIKIKLFYKNYKADPEVIDCAADTYIEKTIPKTTTPLTDALQLLLSNTLTAEERNFGLGNPFEDEAYAERFDNFKLDTVVINNGEAKLTFEDPDFFSSGGSCRIGIMTSMIDQTAKQFQSVDRVTYYPYDVFQP